MLFVKMSISSGHLDEDVSVPFFFSEINVY